MSTYSKFTNRQGMSRKPGCFDGGGEVSKSDSTSDILRVLGDRGGDEPAPNDQGQDGPDGLEVACEDLLTAIRRGDPKAMADAFRNALVLADEPGGQDEDDGGSTPTISTR
jgi:hypothetical protein